MEKQKKILAIDDVTHILKVIECRLKATGYNVVTTSYENLAFKKAKDEKPDLILLDVMMSKADSGFIILSQLKKDPETKNIPVIMLTAKGDKNDIVQAVKLGATDYLKKPFDSQTLVSKIQDIFAKNSST